MQEKKPSFPLPGTMRDEPVPPVTYGEGQRCPTKEQ